jgi:hypothetical protein
MPCKLKPTRYNYSKDDQLGVLIWVCNNLETKDKGKTTEELSNWFKGKQKTPILRFEPISHMEAYFYLIKPIFLPRIK